MLKQRSWIVVSALFAAVAALFHFISPNIPEHDSFFYAALGDNLLNRGFFNVDFPWLPLTTLHKFGVSLWWGFAVFMAPFSTLGISGIKVAGLLLTIFALLAYYWTVRRFNLRWPLVWPLFLLFAAPNVLFSFLMTRPQLLSFGFSMLLFAFLIAGNWLGVFIASFGVTWFHLNFAWLPIGIAGIVLLSKIILSRINGFVNVKHFLTIGFAAAGGVLLGWLLRPEPIKAAKLFYVQIFKLLFEKQSGLNLLFGFENLPLSVNVLFRNFWPLLVVWLGAVLIVLISGRTASSPFAGGNGGNKNANLHLVYLWSTFLLSATFFGLTMLVARKAYGLWAAFGLLFAAGVFTYVIPNLSFYTAKKVEKLARVVLVGALAFTLIWSGFKTLNTLQKSALPPDYLKKPALWLEKNSREGDLVFNMYWDQFSPLFYWNRRNFYVGGLDPIFQYDYNPKLYWYYHYLSVDLVTKKTCGIRNCLSPVIQRDKLEDTYGILKNSFGAKYVILDENRSPAVNFYMNQDNRFVNRFTASQKIIYEIK